MIELGVPLDDFLRFLRNDVRVQKASGDIVVVGIDGRSLEAVGQWPWPRTYHARMIDGLIKAGAKRIFFDIDFSTHSNPENDQIMADALKRAPGKVFLATLVVIDQATGQRTEQAPIPEFAAHANLININWWYDIFGVPRGFPYATRLNGVSSPSMAAQIADVSGQDDQYFRADYAINVDTIPKISAVDVLNGTLSANSVSGKDVIIASSTIEIGDVYRLPGHRLISGVYFWVLAAETLKRGTPVEYSWFGPWLFGMVLTAGFMANRRKVLRRSIFVGGIIGLLTIPLILDQNLIFVQIVPALLALAIVGVARMRANFRKRLHDRGTTNAVSGLLNMAALREAKVDHDSNLIAVKIHNFLAITATFPPEREKELIDQISARLTLGTGGADIYQGDDGVFAWIGASADAATARDQLEALYAIFRSPIKVGDQSVTLHVTFGFDQNSTQSIPNRLSAALLAADEAVDIGHRWALTNVGKSNDVKAKLLLVGRLDEALSSDEIWVAYQPKLDLATNRICGAEALIRWSHPERGEISPEEFILLAEEQDRIDNLTMFVLNDAIRTLSAVLANGIDFDVAINLSPRAFEGFAIDAIIGAMLINNNIPPHSLTLEITETAAMRPGGDFLAMLKKCRDSGMNVSIDDYGTGLSTLTYLQSIPANEVKIDRSLIERIDQNQDSRLVVHSTIQLIHSLGRTAVAEGIETQAVLDMVTEMGCDKAQGYLIGKPMRFRDMWKLLVDEQLRKVA